jgi:hypothetical protein
MVGLCVAGWSIAQTHWTTVAAAAEAWTRIWF